MRILSTGSGSASRHWVWLPTHPFTTGMSTMPPSRTLSRCSTDSPTWRYGFSHGIRVGTFANAVRSYQGCQIINYRVNSEGKWMVVVGISQQQGRVVGSMQLYSKERGISQHIESHSAAFASINVEGSPLPHHLFSFAVRTPTGAKLQIAEIDHQEPNPRFQKKAVEVFFPQEAVNDFPVAMQVSNPVLRLRLCTSLEIATLNTWSLVSLNA